jgi:hypothetical protein
VELYRCNELMDESGGQCAFAQEYVQTNQQCVLL